jgi:hypothetical protein
MPTYADVCPTGVALRLTEQLRLQQERARERERELADAASTLQDALCVKLAALSAQVATLTADVCGRMLTDADVCRRMLAYAGVCLLCRLSMLRCIGCSRCGMLTYADVC